MPVEEIEISELEEFEPTRVDGVGKGANGFPVLMLKSIGEICDACNGESGHCTKCRGTGLMPQVGMTAKELAEAAKEKGVALSGASVPVRHDCPTCGGTGVIEDPENRNGKKCIDCNGSGRDGQYNVGHVEDAASEARDTRGEFSVAHADEGKITFGEPRQSAKAASGERTTTSPDGTGFVPYDLESAAKCTCCPDCGGDCDGDCCSKCTMDAEKSVETCDDEDCNACKEVLEKKKLSYKERKKLSSSAFVFPKERKYPIHDIEHARDALSRVAANGTPEEKAKVRAAVHRRYPSIEMAEKAAEVFYGVLEDEYLEKRDFDPNVGGGVDRDKLPDSDFAGKNRSFPIVTEADVSDALHSIGRAGSDNYDAATLKRNILRIARRKGFKVPESDEAEKSEDTEVIVKDGMVSGPNPFLTGDAKPDDGDDIDTGPAPGSPEWEAVDAATATAAAESLMEAAEYIRTFAQREAVEVAAGEGNDVFDAYAAESALYGVSQALGVMAQMAFHEGLAAAKSLGADATVEKAGRRLSRKSVSSLAALRDHITNLLGDDDPSKPATDNDDATEKSVAIDMDKLSEEIRNMDIDELTKVLDARDEKLVGSVVDAVKASRSAENSEDKSDAAGKNENSKGKNRKKKVHTTDDTLEDEATQGTHDSASGVRAAEGGVKSVDVELTPEEIKANEAAEKARKELKAAKKARKAAAENAALKKALEESRAEADKAVKTLEERLEDATNRLATVEKMAAPTTVRRTGPQDSLRVAAERGALDADIAKFESMARETTDTTLAAGYAEMAKAARAKLAGLHPQEGS